MNENGNYKSLCKSSDEGGFRYFDVQPTSNVNPIVYYRNQLWHFIRLYIKDIKKSDKIKTFEEFGLTMYTGRQGSGKTLSLVEYLYRMKIKYPNVMIVTNFEYAGQDKVFEHWTDLLNIRNGENGVIFAIDEIQNEFDSNSWKDFPAWVLAEITQQRKQRIKIIGSSQVFTRVVKQLREQCYEVVECSCISKRWIFQRAFDGAEYSDYTDSVNKPPSLHRLWRRSFVQNDPIRSLYDTYKKIEKIKRGQYERKN